MDGFAFLAGISPWWWVAFGVALGALEMATMSFFLIWPGLAAIAMAGVLLLAPDASGNAQIVIFAILAIALTFAGRMLMHRYGDRGADTGLNDRAAQMIGRHAVVADFTGPEGHVTIDGVRWQARWPAGETAVAGDTVEIARSEGMTLFVKA
jgi:membrane protein implicated in regulation of membrane protease activity